MAAPTPARVNPPALNVQPEGLLGFLQLKNGGVYPQYLNNVLQPTLDLFDHYTEANAKVNAQSVAYSAGVSATTLMLSPITVPSRSWVYVKSLRWRFTFQNAADTMIGMPALNDDTFTALTYVGLAPTEFNYPAGAAQSWLGCIATPFWMPPGAQLVWFSRNSVNTGGLALFDFTVRFADFII